MTTDDLTALAALLAKMTPGTLIAAGWGDGSTLNGMTNIFNEDAEVLLMECIPEHDAAGIVALVNAAPALLASAARAAELEAEVAKLSSIVRAWHYLAVGPDEMGDYFTHKQLVKISEPYASPALKALEQKQ